MSADPNNYDDPSFFEKYGVAIGAAVVVLLLSGVGLGFYFFKGKIPPPKKPEEIMVQLLPPPPPPPPPPSAATPAAEGDAARAKDGGATQGR